MTKYKHNDFLSMSNEQFKRLDNELRETNSNPIAQQMAKEQTDNYYLNEWIYQKNEMLDGKSPVKALKSKKGRAKLEKLFQHIEAMNKIMPDFFYKFDFNRLRKKFGMKE